MTASKWSVILAAASFVVVLAWFFMKGWRTSPDAAVAYTINGLGSSTV